MSSQQVLLFCLSKSYNLRYFLYPLLANLSIFPEYFKVMSNNPFFLVDCYTNLSKYLKKKNIHAGIDTALGIEAASCHCEERSNLWSKMTPYLAMTFAAKDIADSPLERPKYFYFFGTLNSKITPITKNKPKKRIAFRMEPVIWSMMP